RREPFLTACHIAGDDAALQHTVEQSHPPALEFPYAQGPLIHQVVTVAPGVLWVRLPLPFALDHINVWLLRDGAGWTLVDTGIASDVTRAAWEHMLADVLEGDPVARVIATHAHPDHLGLAHWFTERYACTLWMTQGEYLNAHAVWNDVAGYGSAALGRLFAQHGLERTRVDAIVTRGNL